MEDVSRRLVGEMAACIKANVEAGEARPAPEATASDGPGAIGGGGASALSSSSPAQPQTAVATAKPVNAIGLLFSVLWARLRGVFGAKT